MTRSATCENPESRFYAGFIGDGVLMYASDYPHSECQFPNSIDNILAWSSLSGDTRQKLFWDNASRFFKQT
jgi:predicted TIM-barrel fold metal-dependent hydrolase